MARRAIEPYPANTRRIIQLSSRDGAPQETPIVCEKIRYYRKLRGLEQKQLARQLGITPNTVTNWESGRARPDMQLLPRLCEALQVSFYDLFDVPNPFRPYTDDEVSLVEDYQALSKSLQVVAREMITGLRNAERIRAMSPLVRKTSFVRPLAAGIGDPTDFDDEGEPIYLHKTSLTDQADYVFRVNGDSMLPKYQDGDHILVRKLDRATDLILGDIAAFMLDNELYIKQYQKDGLHSLNQAYPVMPFSDYDRVFLIGKVIGILDEHEIATPDKVELFESAGAI